ncbi:MAG TPA: mannonate dehydratase [Chitinophagaceae bacterium]|nr:mannonate dehydratase [Chitinophagaceae bacterium]
MTACMRWFGPSDPVSLSHIKQAGCTGVVTALHEVPNGEVWPLALIEQRRSIIEKEGLSWQVVESLPVHEDIKTRTGNFRRYLDHYKESILNLGKAGITTITYNFMPVLDWTRTDLSFELEDGSRALRFEMAAFCAFDRWILKRDGSENDYTASQLEQAWNRFISMTEAEKMRLQQNIIAGLPGSEESFTLDELKNALGRYQNIDSQLLRRHLVEFLQDICPVAEQAGIRMAIHPDDPPFPILGLPRIVSTGPQLEALFQAVPSLSNGLCFCTGSLGVRPDNDLPRMVRQFGERIQFLHLRSTLRNDHGDFFEANHLEGDVDMVSVVREVLAIMRSQGRSLPMRPDHGHQMLDDLTKKTNPGYSAIGRLRGLAELRGLERGIAGLLYN